MEEGDIAIADDNAASTNCGQTNFIAQDTEQELTSPNYPQNYPNNLACAWHVNTNSDGRPAEISFTAFKTEATHDVVRLYLDGSFTQSFSGSDVPNPSSFRFNRNAKIAFNSDDSIARTGFRMVFKSGSYLCKNFVI